MSWPGENDPPTGGGGGRGRRRRADSPAEDPYQAAQQPGGTGRRGSGEYERPAEYVARAEQEAAAYDQAAAYEQYDQHDQYDQYSQQGQQGQHGLHDQYGRDDQYGQPQQYDRYSGYADPAYFQSGTYQQPQDSYQPRDSYQPHPDPYQQQAFYQQDSYQQQPQAPYQEQPYGYANPAYPEAPAPSAYGSPSSSGFYQPTVPGQPSYQPAPQPSYEPVPQPSYEPAPQPSYEPQPAPAPEPAFVPQPPSEWPQPSERPDKPEQSEKEPPEDKDNDGEISNWLNFLEGDAKVDRARRHRVRLISAAVAAVLLVVGGVGAWFLFGGDDAAKATQTTVLLQVKDTDGNAVGNVVLVAAKTEVAGQTDPKARGAALLIPSELTVESSALDSQPFGGAMPTTAPAGKDALSSLIGVDVDGVWSLDPLTFASLLNNLIGVTVDVDPASAAAVLDPSGKPVFQPGRQDMTGDKAAYYATYRPKGEAPAKQLARFGQVVDGMLAHIPKQASTTAAVLDSLAAVPDPALPNDRLAGILTALGGEEQNKRFDQQTLPLRADGSGVMDLDQASAVVKQLLGGAARAKDDGGLSRVSVADGTGRADTVSSRAMAASKLLGGGYTPVDQGVVGQNPTTYVLVPNQDATSLGKQVALALGLAENAVRVQPFDTTLTDARVVLGVDWTQIGQVPADQAPSPSDATPGAPSSGPTSAGAPSGADTGGKSGTGKASTTHKPTSGGTR